MSKPTVIFDSTVDIPNIQMFYYSEDTGSNLTVNQTKIEGILTPIVSINGMSITFKQILYFKLSSRDVFPTLEISINDSENLIKILNRPGENNTIQVQILPEFDNTYKKLNLLFYIVSYEAIGDYVEFQCLYSIPGIFDTKLESFGKVNTYQLCNTIASKLRLGLVSNVAGCSDSRWVYCDNTTYMNKLIREMSYSGNTNQVFDMWIDFRNNLSLVDIYERIRAEDTQLSVWVADSIAPDMEGERTPKLVPAMISNAVLYRGTPMFTQEYTNLNNNANNIVLGNDSVLMTHSFDSFVSDDSYLVNGSKSDTDVSKIVYGGEYFGDFNYISQQGLNNRYRSKVRSSRLQLSLVVPCLGLMRGDKVNVAWYEYNTYLSDTLEDSNTSNGTEPVINKNVTGQYYIDGCTIEYNLNSSSTGWKQTLILSKVNTKI